MSGRGYYLWSVSAAVLLASWLPSGLSAQVDAVFANSGQPNRVCLGDRSSGFSCSDIGRDTDWTSGVALGELHSNEIFGDGFESGDTSAWTVSAP